jgi:hypothetical protein
MDGHACLAAIATLTQAARVRLADAARLLSNNRPACMLPTPWFAAVCSETAQHFKRIPATAPGSSCQTMLCMIGAAAT